MVDLAGAGLLRSRSTHTDRVRAGPAGTRTRTQTCPARPVTPSHPKLPLRKYRGADRGAGRVRDALLTAAVPPGRPRLLGPGHRPAHSRSRDRNLTDLRR